jgi:hypothetical protein
MTKAVPKRQQETIFGKNADGRHFMDLRIVQPTRI